MEAELEKLESNLGGIADMRRQPDAVFIVDLRKEQLAVREARRLGMPVIALVDTNCDPDEAEYVIPGTTTRSASCSLIVRAIADAIEAGKQRVSAAEMSGRRNGAVEAARAGAGRGARAAGAGDDDGDGRARGPGRAGACGRARCRAGAGRGGAAASRARRGPGVRGSEPAASRTLPRPSERRRRVRRRAGDRDLGGDGQGAPRRDERRDDGVQARAPGDGRRLRRRSQAPAREGDGLGRQARRPRDDRGQGRHAARRRHGCDRGRRLRDRARLEQRRLPLVRRARPARGRTSAARRPSPSSTRSGRRSRRASARTSASSAPGA